MDDRYRKGFERILADTPDGPSYDELATRQPTRVSRPWLARPSLVVAGAFVFTLVVLGLSMLIVTLGDDTPPASEPMVDYVKIEWTSETSMICEGMAVIDNGGFDSAIVEIWGPSTDGYTRYQASAPDGTLEVLIDQDVNGDGRPDKAWGTNGLSDESTVFRSVGCAYDQDGITQTIGFPQHLIDGPQGRFSPFVRLRDIEGRVASLNEFTSIGTTTESVWRGLPVIVRTTEHATKDPILGQQLSWTEALLDPEEMRMERVSSEDTIELLGSWSYVAAVIDRHLAEAEASRFDTTDLDLIQDIPPDFFETTTTTVVSAPMDLLDAAWGPEPRFDTSGLGTELVLDRSEEPPSSRLAWVYESLDEGGIEVSGGPVWIGAVDGVSGYVLGTTNDANPLCQVLSESDERGSSGCSVPRSRSVSFTMSDTTDLRHMSMYTIDEPAASVIAVTITTAGGQSSSYWQRPYASSALIVADRLAPDATIIAEVYDQDGNVLVSRPVLEPSTTTTEPPPEQLDLWVYGPSPRYTQDGEVTIELMTSHEASVTIDGAELEWSHTEPAGRLMGGLTLQLDTGEHLIAIEAVAADTSLGKANTYLKVIVDPSLDRELGFIQGLGEAAGGVFVADFDDIVWNESPDTEGDFYTNDSALPDGIELSPEASVSLQVCFSGDSDVGSIDGPCVAPWPTSFERFVFLMGTGELPIVEPNGLWYGSPESPFWITLDDGVVVQVEEQYLP